MAKRTRLTHPLLRKESWTLLEWWVLATIVGGVIGIGIASVASIMANTLGPINAPINVVMLLHVVGALEGMALGFTQWLVLRRYIKHVGGWIVATSIGAIAAWLIGLKVIVVLTLIFFNGVMAETTPLALLKSVFWLGTWMGAVVGLAQWLVLRTHVRRGIIWVLANALAWGLGLLVAVMGITWGEASTWATGTALVPIAAGATAGAVVGAITGITLVGLLKPRLRRHELSHDLQPDQNPDGGNSHESTHESI